MWRRSAVLALLLLTACRNGVRGQPDPSAPNGEREAEIFFSTGVAGYVEPCGCTSKPLGGIQRLASVILSSPVPHGLVDAGQLFLPTEADPAAREQHVLKARILARVYRRLGAMAINVAASDLGEGFGFLKELQGEGSVPLVSANVRPTEASGPSVAQSFLRELGGIKLGFTGVATPESFEGKGGVAVVEYAPALKGEIASLRKRGAEVVVVLAHLDERAAEELARAVPEIDLIVRAPGTPITRPPAAPKQVDGVVILEAGAQGQHVGRLHLTLGAGSPPRPIPFDDGGEGDRKRRELVDRKILALEREITELGDKPETLEARRARAAQIAKLKASVVDRPKDGPAGGGGPKIRFELVELTEAVREEPEAKTILEGYYTQLEKLNLEKGDVEKCKAGAGAKTFVGSKKCAECHEEEYAFWKDTKHASAWATLERQNKHFDLTCIGCHTIGYEKPGGFCRIKDVGLLKDVGCENCHGPGSAHVEDRDSDSIVLSNGEATCKSECHVPEHSDQFDYATYLPKITGPGHPLSKPR